MKPKAIGIVLLVAGIVSTACGVYFQKVVEKEEEQKSFLSTAGIGVGLIAATVGGVLIFGKK
jgi:hypothetical protein